jgi:retron-type reverse transcriptase
MQGLIRRYLEAGIMANGVVMERWEGTPQGGPLSPLLANVLLDEVDKELTDMNFHHLMKPTSTRTLDGETYLSAAQGVKVPGQGLVGTSQVIMLVPPRFADARP